MNCVCWMCDAAIEMPRREGGKTLFRRETHGLGHSYEGKKRERERRNRKCNELFWFHIKAKMKKGKEEGK